MHDCRSSPKAAAPSCCCSSTGRKEAFFPCRPSSPLSFRSVSPDRLIADGGGSPPRLQKSTAVSTEVVAGSTSGTSFPSSYISYSSCASHSPSSKTTLPSPLSVVRVPWATFSGGWREEDNGSGGGSPASGSSRSQQPKRPSSTSQWVPTAAAAAGTAPRRTPSTTPDLSSHEELDQSGSSPAASAGRGSFFFPAAEQMANSSNTSEGKNDDVRRIAGIEEFEWGPLCPATTRSPRRGISGISGGCSETSTAKRTRFVQITPSSALVSSWNDPLTPRSPKTYGIQYLRALTFQLERILHLPVQTILFRGIPGPFKIGLVRPPSNAPSKCMDKRSFRA